MEQEIIDMVLKFRDSRNWKQFHNPKDLAISISLEASELLEIFQWSGSCTDAYDKKDNIKEELADVLIYCIMMADICDIDIDTIIKEKLDKNNKKYPVKLSYGNKLKYTELKELEDK